MLNRPRVRICSWCQRINYPDFAKYNVGVDPKVKVEIGVVDKQVRANLDNFNFTGGICMLHLTQMYQNMPGKEEQLTLALKQAELQEGGPVPCLLTDTELRHAYMRGLFTPKLRKQALKSQQQAKINLTERLKKLAGIHS
jgi:hypothetical protein